MFVSHLALSAEPVADCEKTAKVQLGMAEKQLKHLLGNPSSVELGGGQVTYQWANDAGDSVRVLFIREPGVTYKDSKAVMASVRCKGARSDLVAPEWSARVGIQALRTLPGGRALPLRLPFEEGEYFLAYAAQEQDGRRYLEYLPQGQNLGQWREMVSSYLNPPGVTPQQVFESIETGQAKLGNPHFKRLAANAGRICAGYPVLGNTFVEYLTVCWKSFGNNALDMVHSIRIYNPSRQQREDFIAEHEAQAQRRADALDAMRQVIPPDFSRQASVYFTTNGTEDGDVWVPAERPANASGQMEKSAE